MEPVKPEPETSSEYDAFKTLLNRIIVVPHSEIVKRESVYQQRAALNPNRRGPKPKRKRASRAPVA